MASAAVLGGQSPALNVSICGYSWGAGWRPCPRGEVGRVCEVLGAEPDVLLSQLLVLQLSWKRCSEVSTWGTRPRGLCFPEVPTAPLTCRALGSGPPGVRHPDFARSSKVEVQGDFLRDPGLLVGRGWVSPWATLGCLVWPLLTFLEPVSPECLCAQEHVHTGWTKAQMKTGTRANTLVDASLTHVAACTCGDADTESHPSPSQASLRRGTLLSSAKHSKKGPA